MDIVDRIKKLCEEKKISIMQLELELGFSNGSISKWKKSSPKVSNLEKVAQYFSVSIDFLLGKSTTKMHLSQSPTGYYTDPEIAQIAEELRTDPDRRILFDASKNLNKDDIDTVLKIIDGLKARDKE